MFSLTSWVRSRSRKSSTIRKSTRTRLGLNQLEGRETPASLYDVAWLGTLNAGDNFSVAQSINDHGQVAGNS